MYQMTIRRKLAIASWDAPREGNIYGRIQLDTTEVQRFLDHVRATTGEKVTLTHFVGRCVGEALSKMPSLNGRIFLGKYRPHETADLAFLVALEEGADLAKAKVVRVNEKSVSDIAKELRELAGKLHKGQDDDFNKSKGVIKLLPTWILKPMLSWIGWLGGCGGFSIKALGVEPFPFGAAVVTSVGMLGIDEGIVPPTPFAHAPLYVCLGAVRPTPWIIDGEIGIRPIVTITATLDHRFIDGFQAGTLAKQLRQLFADPWQLEPKVEKPAA